MKIIMFFILTIYLVGCANKFDRNLQDTQNRYFHISKYKSWQAIGKASIQSLSDSGTVSLYWNQNEDEYDISLIGPFGQGSIDLIGDNKFIYIKTKSKEIEGDNVDKILEKEIGLKIPISHLKWWILGLPSPNSSYSKIENNEGLLEQIDQGKWIIEYKSFRPNDDNVLLPYQFKVRSENVNLNVVVSAWSMQK